MRCHTCEQGAVRLYKDYCVHSDDLHACTRSEHENCSKCYNMGNDQVEVCDTCKDGYDMHY